jgi:hypothetical protein
VFGEWMSLSAGLGKKGRVAGWEAHVWVLGVNIKVLPLNVDTLKIDGFGLAF